MSCDICDSNALNSLGRIQGYRQNSYYDIIECKTCGTSSASPRAVDGKIYDAIYKNVDKVPGYARYCSLAKQILRERDALGYIAKVEESYYAVCKTLVEKLADRAQTTICEVGCGQGYLTYALVKAGFKATGVDISQKAVDLARTRYGDYYFCGNLKDFVERNLHRPQYVVATELIEHLTDPVSFVSEMLEFVSPGGSLVVTTPNKLSSAGPIWDTELPPVHLWWFTKKGLTEIARKVDCEINFVDLTEFYKMNVKFGLVDDAVSIQKMPVLDDNYNLIQARPDEALSASIKRRLKNVLPNSLVRKMQEIRAANLHLHIIDDEHSRALCATYTKK